MSKTTKQQALEAALRDIQGLNTKFNNPTFKEMQLARFAKDVMGEEDEDYRTVDSTFDEVFDTLLYGEKIDYVDHD